MIVVDDGTAKIDCILYINEKLRTFNQKVNEAFNVVINKEDEKKDNATIMLLSKCKSKLKTVATKNSDIKLGDRVCLLMYLRILFLNFSFLGHINRKTKYIF